MLSDLRKQTADRIRLFVVLLFFVLERFILIKTVLLFLFSMLGRSLALLVLHFLFVSL